MAKEDEERERQQRNKARGTTGNNHFKSLGFTLEGANGSGIDWDVGSNTEAHVKKK